MKKLLALFLLLGSAHTEELPKMVMEPLFCASHAEMDDELSVSYDETLHFSGLTDGGLLTAIYTSNDTWSLVHASSDSNYCYMLGGQLTEGNVLGISDDLTTTAYIRVATNTPSWQIFLIRRPAILLIEGEVWTQVK